MALLHRPPPGTQYIFWQSVAVLGTWKKVGSRKCTADYREKYLMVNVYTCILDIKSTSYLYYLFYDGLRIHM